MAHKLLVPLDGSELAEAALDWAAHLAQRRGLSLVLARIVPWPSYTVTGMDGYLPPETYQQILEGYEEEARAYLEQARGRLADQGLEAETTIGEGPPGDCILDLADELGTLAIVMATHGRGGLARAVLGSVAEHILQHATIPVLLVPAHVARPAHGPALGRLLVALDGSPLAERALEAARELLAEEGTLVLVEAVAPIERAVMMDDGGVMIPDEAATQQAMAAAEEYLHSLSARAGGRVAAHVRRGRAAEQILATATEENADLIVMATHGRTGPARWWVGSVADEVVRHADRPVFLVSARVLAARAAGPFTVGDVMTRDLATLRDDEPPIAALRKLLRRRVSGAPVVDARGELVGVISEYDLLRWQAQRVEELARDPAPSAAAYARRLETGAVRELMSHPVVTIHETAPLSAAIKLFLEHRLRRLPVMSQGRLVGILARADVLKAMAEQWATAGSEAVTASQASSRRPGRDA